MRRYWYTFLTTFCQGYATTLYYLLGPLAFLLGTLAAVIVVMCVAGFIHGTELVGNRIDKDVPRS